MCIMRSVGGCFHWGRLGQSLASGTVPHSCVPETRRACVLWWGWGSAPCIVPVAYRLSPAALAVSFDYPLALLLPATWVEGSYSLLMELFPGEVKQRVKALDWKGEVRASLVSSLGGKYVSELHSCTPSL